MVAGRTKEQLISVVIANRNHADVLDGCLSSVFRSEYGPFEVIVVDDESTDSSVQIAKKHPCRLIELDRNVGQGFARNIGADVAKGEILLFIDSDTEIGSDALKIINERLSDPGLDAVIGIVEKEPLKGGPTARYMCLEWYFRATTHHEEFSDYFFTTVGAIRKKVFNEVGQFQHPWMDDFEFNSRLPQDTKIALDTRIRVKHTYGSFWQVMHLFFKRSSVLINLKNLKRVDKIFYTWRRAAGVVLSLLTFLTFITAPPITLLTGRWSLLTIPLATFILFLVATMNLFIYILNESGIVLALYSIICGFFFSLAIALGSIWGRVRGGMA